MDHPTDDERHPVPRVAHIVIKQADPRPSDQPRGAKANPLRCTADEIRPTEPKSYSTSVSRATPQLLRT